MSWTPRRIFHGSLPCRPSGSARQIARDSLGDLELTTEQQALFQTTLDKVIAFADTALKEGGFTYEQVEAFARDIEIQEKELTSLCAHVQVAHWFTVRCRMEEAAAGDDWENTYGLTNSIYVTRQNNILFSVMAQFFGEEAINNRLLMVETTSFQTTPEEMLDVLAHIIADRTLSRFFSSITIA